MSEPSSTFEIGPALDGRRLDEALAALVPGLSRMRLRTLLDAGEVRVNNAPQAAGWRVSVGDRLEVSADLEGVSAMTPEPIPLEILFEDSHVVVVVKPAGMVVHPAGRHRSGTLANGLAYHFNVVGAADPPIRPGMVHRLDRATSGLMVVAKTQQALSRLTVQFQNKTVMKRYLARVHGRVEPEEGEWSAPIGSDPTATPKWGIRESGRAALSRYRVLKHGADWTDLELEPVTGRTNQLRLHCAHFGHPIAGDALFGRADDGFDRLYLHAWLLEFRHPDSGEMLRFESGAPWEVSRE